MVSAICALLYLGIGYWWGRCDGKRVTLDQLRGKR